MTLCNLLNNVSTYESIQRRWTYGYVLYVYKKTKTEPLLRKQPLAAGV